MLTSPPNLLTGARILAIPAMIGAFYIPGDFGKWATCAIFTIAAITDYFDGYLARSLSMQSPLGRMLDPIADKLLVGAAILMLVHFDRSPILPALVILCREILVSGLREFLAEVRVGLPVSRLAKWKTGVQMTAIGFLLAGSAAPWWLFADQVGWYGLWLAAGLTLITGLRLSGGRAAPFDRDARTDAAGQGQAAAPGRPPSLEPAGLVASGEAP